jgi:hypothetical protein
MPVSKDVIPSDATASAAEHLLDQLADFEPTSFPVLSLYLNLQPDEHGRIPDLKSYLEREFKLLARTWPQGTPERESFDHDSDRILAFIQECAGPKASGLALFDVRPRTSSK